VKPFWRNIVLIALAHVALIAGLIRWSVAARGSSNPESIVWLGGAGDLSADDSKKQESPSPKQPRTGTESSESEQDEAADEKPVVTAAKSEIELPSATPKPTPTPPQKPTATPAPKPIAKPTPRKTIVAKTSPKPLAKAKPIPAKATPKSEKKEKIALTKTRLQGAAVSSPPTSSTGKAGSADGLPAVASAKAGGSSGSEFGWYGNMLHDRFYSAWIQPTTSVPSGSKISTLVKVRIEKDGRVSKFEIIKPSENVVVNESVEAIAKRVTEVDAPPDGLSNGDHYDVKINFELNTEQEAPN